MSDTAFALFAKISNKSESKHRKKKNHFCSQISLIIEQVLYICDNKWLAS